MSVWTNLKHRGSLNISENLMEFDRFSQKMLICIKFSFQFQELHVVLKYRYRGLWIEVKEPCPTWWQENCPR